VQDKLREELLTVDTDNPTMDQLIALPYLDMVVRETMRLHAPVPATSKLAMKDDILPLSNPVVDQKGRVHYSIRYVNFQTPINLRLSLNLKMLLGSVKKGCMIFIPIAAIHRDKSIWGEDAELFR
jgi:cytochrome P450